MKLWKLMISAAIISVIMIWACVAIDGTARAQEQVTEIQIGHYVA